MGQHTHTRTAAAAVYGVYMYVRIIRISYRIIPVSHHVIRVFCKLNLKMKKKYREQSCSSAAVTYVYCFCCTTAAAASAGVCVCICVHVSRIASYHIIHTLLYFYNKKK